MCSESIDAEREPVTRDTKPRRLRVAVRRFERTRATLHALRCLILAGVEATDAMERQIVHYLADRATVQRLTKGTR